MDITWYGQSCFRLSGRGLATIVTDPYDDNIGLPALKIRGDVVTVSNDSASHNHVEAVTSYRHSLNGPGEYEIGGVFVTGIATSRQAGQTENVLFLFDFGSVTIAHLGDMGSVPSQTKIEALEQVDVLLVPVGSGNSLNAAQAAELVSMLEPKIVIPMHYQIPGLDHTLEDVERFLKEMGVTRPEEEANLKLTSSKLPEETQVVLLTPKIRK